MIKRQFSITIDEELLQQIQGRANANRRSRSTEIVVLLEFALEELAIKDKQVVEMMKNMPKIMATLKSYDLKGKD